MTKFKNILLWCYSSRWPFYLAFAILVLPIIFYIAWFSPDVVVVDRLNILSPIYFNQNFFQGFFHQHGPHFLGLSHALNWIGLEIFGKNPKTDLLVGIISIIALAASSVALRKAYCDLALTWKDLPILLLPLSLAPAATFFILPHVHYMLPLFAILFGVSWFVKNTAKRIVFQSLLIFIGSFSGFAFIAVGTFLLLDVVFHFKDGFKQFRKGSYKLILKPIVVMITVLTFLKHYNVAKMGSEESASINVRFGYFLEVLQNAFATAWSGKGSILFPVFCVVIAVAIVLSLKQGFEKKDVVILNLILAFAAFVAVSSYGRSGVDVNSGFAQRYYPTLLLLPLSVFFLAREKIKTPIFQSILWVTFLVMYALPIKPALADGKYFSDKFSRWKSCYSKSGDAGACNEEVGMTVVQATKRHLEIYRLANEE